MSSPAPPSLQPASAPARVAHVQVVATAFVSLFCVVGLAFWGLPFFYDFMVRQFGWTHAQVTSGNALAKLVVAPVFAVVAGYMADRIGPRRLLMAGVALSGLALIALAAATTITLFRIFFLLNALGYVLGGPLPVQVLLSRWFDRARGKAMGVAYIGIGLGGALAPWMATPLVARFGWQIALASMGALIIVIALPMAWALPETTAVAGRTPSTTGTPAPLRAALASRAFYMLVIASMCSIAAVSGTQQTLKLFLSFDLHYSQISATRVISLVLACSMVGRLLMGWLADRWRKKNVMLLIYALVAAGIPLLFIAEFKPAMYGFAAIFGLGLGGEYMIVPLMAAEIFGVEMLGRMMGIMLAAGGVAEALAPWTVGALHDSTGSYASGFVALLVIAVAGLLSAAALPGSPPRAGAS